ncbi:MAG: hypothetical protein ACAI44_11025 [Candidatus Sericytochromatia bacterium]
MKPIKPAGLIARITRSCSHSSLRAGLVVGLLLGFLWLYLSLTRVFPFDLAWDMDMLTVHDALLLNSQQLPQHVDHPKFAMHLISAGALAAGQQLGLVSVSDFAGLRQSPSPMLCIAELTLFLRAVEAVVVWLILVLATALLWRLFPRQHLLRLAAIPLLGLQVGLLYCAMTTRTEAFSIFFLLLGLLLFSSLYTSALRQRRLALEVLAWLLGGFGFGLALLTKLQAIMAAPFFLIVCFYLYSRPASDETADDETPNVGTPGEDPSNDENPPEKAPADAPPLWPASNGALPSTLQQAIPLLLGLSLLLWSLLAWLAWQTPSLPGLPPVLIPLRDFSAGKLGLAQFLPHLKLQIVWLVLLASAWLSLALARFRPHSPHRRFLLLYPLFWCGLLWAFATPLLVAGFRSQGLSRGWQYLLQMAQSCIWTDTNAATAATAGSFSTTLTFALVTNKNYLLLALAAGVIAGYLLLQPAERSIGLKACLASFFAGTFVLLVGSRAMLRDTIWFEFLGSLSVLILIHHCWPGLRRIPLLQTLLVLCLLIPSCSNGLNLAAAKDQVYVYFAPFQSARYAALVDAFFAKHDMDLPQLFMAAYGQKLFPPDNSDRDILRRAVEQARLLGPLQQIVDLQFINLKVPVRALGLAEPGFPVWSDGTGWARFMGMADFLRGSTLVNPELLPDTSAHSWLGMNDQAPLNQRWIKTTGGSRIAIYPTWDMQVLICVSRTDYQRLFQLPPPGPAPLQIAVGAHSEGFYPLQIVGDHTLSIVKSLSGFTEFDRKWLHGFRYPPFFLVRNGNAWGPDFPRWANMEALIEDK